MYVRKQPLLLCVLCSFNPWPLVFQLPFIVRWGVQSRQSARLSLQSSELAPPAPSPAGECCPHPSLAPRGGGTHSLAGRGGGSQFGRRDRHSGTLGIVYYIHSTGGGLSAVSIPQDKTGLFLDTLYALTLIHPSLSPNGPLAPPLPLSELFSRLGCCVVSCCVVSHIQLGQVPPNY